MLWYSDLVAAITLEMLRLRRTLSTGSHEVLHLSLAHQLVECAETNTVREKR